MYLRIRNQLNSESGHESWLSMYAERQHDSIENQIS